MNRRRAIIALSALFAITLGVGIMTTSAYHPLGPCEIFPDPAILWYSGATSEFANIYNAEAITDADSWHNASVIGLTQVGSAGTSNQVNSYTYSDKADERLGYAEPLPLSSCPATYWNTFLNLAFLANAPSRKKQFAACHELGHTFGLDHNDAESDSSCMSNLPLPQSLGAPQPSAHDIAQLAALYPAAPPPPTPPPPPPDCGHNLQCYPSLHTCAAVCCGVCERRINCGGATAHKCFEN